MSHTAKPTTPSPSDDEPQRKEDGEQEREVAKGYVRLVSGDGFSFTVAQEYACASSVIHAMLNSSFKESHTHVIHLPHVSGRVLEKVCQYFYYVPRFQHRHTPHTTDNAITNHQKQQAQIHHPEEGSVETFPIPSDVSIDVFLCAKYLDL